MPNDISIEHFLNIFRHLKTSLVNLIRFRACLYHMTQSLNVGASETSEK